MSAELLEEIRTRLIPVIRKLDLNRTDDARAMLGHELGAPGRVHELMLEGMRGDWLLTRERQGLRFGRLAKDLEGYSADAVLLREQTPGPRHRHPRGEISILLPIAGSPSFEGHTEGWAVCAPGSEHVPAVRGGEMLILYFLPGGEVDWL